VKLSVDADIIMYKEKLIENHHKDNTICAGGKPEYRS